MLPRCWQLVKVKNLWISKSLPTCRSSVCTRDDELEWHPHPLSHGVHPGSFSVFGNGMLMLLQLLLFACLLSSVYHSMHTQQRLSNNMHGRALHTTAKATTDKLSIQQRTQSSKKRTKKRKRRETWINFPARHPSSRSPMGLRFYCWLILSSILFFFVDCFMSFRRMFMSFCLIPSKRSHSWLIHRMQIWNKFE